MEMTTFLLSTRFGLTGNWLAEMNGDNMKILKSVIVGLILLVFFLIYLVGNYNQKLKLAKEDTKELKMMLEDMSLKNRTYLDSLSLTLEKYQQARIIANRLKAELLEMQSP